MHIFCSNQMWPLAETSAGVYVLYAVLITLQNQVEDGGTFRNNGNWQFVLPFLTLEQRTNASTLKSR